MEHPLHCMFRALLGRGLRNNKVFSFVGIGKNQPPSSTGETDGGILEEAVVLVLVLFFRACHNNGSVSSCRCSLSVIFVDGVPLQMSSSSMFWDRHRSVAIGKSQT